MKTLTKTLVSVAILGTAGLSLQTNDGDMVFLAGADEIRVASATSTAERAPAIRRPDGAPGVAGPRSLQAVPFGQSW